MQPFSWHDVIGGDKMVNKVAKVAAKTVAKKVTKISVDALGSALELANKKLKDFASATKGATNKFKFEFVVKCPTSGSYEATCLLRWLNLQHCGTINVPEKPTDKHVSSHHRLFMGQSAELEIELDKDGNFIPVSFSLNGKKYEIKAQ